MKRHWSEYLHRLPSPVRDAVIDVALVVLNVRTRIYERAGQWFR